MKHTRKLFVAMACIISTQPITSPAGQTSVWAGSPVGKCYTSVDDYLTIAFGAEYRDDENIKIVLVPNANSTKLANNYLWTIDTTPSVNVTRTLFKIQKSGSACAILYVPFSSCVSFKAIRSGRLPRRITTRDSPSPGISITRIIYRLDVAKGTYAPTNCMKIGADEKGVPFPCNKAFQQ